MSRWRIDAFLTSASELACPPGYSAASAALAPVVDEATALKTREAAIVTSKQLAAWQFAKSPVQQLPIALFMMFMAGNAVFSIMVTANNIVTPLRSMVASGTAFARFADPAVDTLTPRLVYCGLLAFQLAFALRKLNNMGLLPTHASDWAPSDPPPRSLEHSHAGVPLL